MPYSPRATGLPFAFLRAPVLALALLRALAPGALFVAACGMTPLSGAPPGGAPPGGDGAPPVSLIVAPEEETTPILEAIRSARRRVLVEMYMLTAPEALAALVQARAGGAEVRVLLEAEPYGDRAANQPAFARLAAAGVDVRWVRRPAGLLHSKLLIVDGRSAQVMTLNLTSAGLRHNREYAAVTNAPDEVRWAERLWNADAIGAEPGPRLPGAERLLVSPQDARTRLAAGIAAARTSILVEMEELSDVDLVAALADAAGQGIDVLVVAPGTNRSAATSAALRRLAEAGVVVRVLATPAIHAKAMVLDGRLVYLGSVNFTRASLDDNREVGLLLNDVVAATRVAATITGDARAGAAF